MKDKELLDGLKARKLFATRTARKIFIERGLSLSDLDKEVFKTYIRMHIPFYKYMIFKRVKPYKKGDHISINDIPHYTYFYITKVDAPD